MKAIFIGSFNPFHIGHLDIVNQAKSIFGASNVLVYCSINQSKKIDCIDTYVEKKKLEMKEVSKKICINIEVICGLSTASLLQNLEQKYNCSVILIRGLRNGQDLDYENTNAFYIKKSYPTAKILYISSQDEGRYYSSSAIRNMLNSNMPDLIEIANTLIV